MYTDTTDRALEKVDARYSLVILVAKRARQLVEDALPLVESQSNKPVTVAMEELAEGTFSYKRVKTGIK